MADASGTSAFTTVALELIPHMDGEFANYTMHGINEGTLLVKNVYEEKSISCGNGDALAFKFISYNVCISQKL